MFLDARTLQSDAAIDCDICIMGAGAAGITIARELAGSPLRVCLLEGGGLEYEEESQSLYKGRNVGRGYTALDVARLRYFGGTTNHWAGNCTPLEPMDFQVRPWVPYSGWPFERAELEPFYERAQIYCQLGPFRYDPEFWSQWREGSPLPLDPARLRTGIAQSSPPTRFGAEYHGDLEQASNITVLLHANVLEIVANEAGERVERLRVGVLDGGEFAVTARYFVLSMGGIENARMLLLSRGPHPNGLGNANDLVGRFFMDHPTVEGAILYPTGDPDLRFYEATQFADFGVVGFLELSEEAQRANRVTNIRAPFVPRTRLRGAEGIHSYNALAEALGDGDIPDDFWRHVGNVIGDIDMVLEKASRKLFDRRLFDSANDFAFFAFITMVEQTPNPDSRVMLDEDRDSFGLQRVKLDWRIADRDRDFVWRCFDLLAQELGRIGLGRVRVLREWADRLWTESLSWGNHHMGTTRMHRDPRQGVVDADCRVHAMTNLYVAGSSVFPTGGHVPPTLTIVALAIRLAERLRTVATEQG